MDTSSTDEGFFWLAAPKIFTAATRTPPENKRLTVDQITFSLFHIHVFVDSRNILFKYGPELKLSRTLTRSGNLTHGVKLPCVNITSGRLGYDEWKHIWASNTQTVTHIPRSLGGIRTWSTASQGRRNSRSRRSPYRDRSPGFPLIQKAGGRALGRQKQGIDFE